MAQYRYDSIKNVILRDIQKMANDLNAHESVVLVTSEYMLKITYNGVTIHVHDYITHFSKIWETRRNGHVTIPDLARMLNTFKDW